MEENFKDTADRELQRLGLAFHGIHLECRTCDCEAFVITLALAETFGWSDIRHVAGAEYQGTCATCTGSSPHKKGASS